jgi:GT2 family glycosyltransferase
MAVPAVSIVIPSYNRGELLAETTAMALRQDYPDFEVIVVDQTAEPSSRMLSLAESSAGRLQYIHRPTPNLPAARNVGVRAARGEIIVFIDDDVVLGPEYIAAHVCRYDDPSVGAVMGITFHPWDTSETAVLEGTLRLFGPRGALPDGAFLVLSVVGCNSSFRRRAIIDAGMSDERFTGSGRGEDTDLSMRVGRLGYKLVFDPKVRLLHLAVTAGGCANRDTAAEERRRDENCRLQLLLLMKNWSSFGVRHVLSNMWGSYRNYALNRSSIESFGKCANQHRKFASHLIHAGRQALPLTAGFARSR